MHEIDQSDSQDLHWYKKEKEKIIVSINQRFWREKSHHFHKNLKHNNCFQHWR